MNLAALPTLRRPVSSLALLLLASLTLSPAAEAAPIASPSQTAGKAYNRVAVLKAVAPAEGDRYRFQTVESLSVEVPAEVTIHLQGFAAGSITAGENYLVVFSDLLKVALASNTFKKDPDGYKALHFSLVGPALFADSPTLRQVFRKSSPDQPDQPDAKGQIDSVFDLFADQDSRVRTIAALEFQYRLGLWPEFDEQQVGRLGKVLAASSDSAEQQLGLLVTSRGIAASHSKAPDWLCPRVRDILKAIPPNLDFDTAQPALAVEALTVLAEFGAAADLGLVRKHAASKHPAVGRQAVEALFALAGSKTSKMAEKILQRGNLTGDAEQLLKARLRRLEREKQQKKSGGL